MTTSLRAVRQSRDKVVSLGVISEDRIGVAGISLRFPCKLDQ